MNKIIVSKILPKPYRNQQIPQSPTCDTRHDLWHYGRPITGLDVIRRLGQNVRGACNEKTEIRR